MTACYGWFLCYLLGELHNVIMNPWCYVLIIGCTSHSCSQHSAFCGLLTLEGNSITADGSYGIVNVILSLYRRVDMHHLKVHWHTAEPTA